jgi:hypothetical protein
VYDDGSPWDGADIEPKEALTTTVGTDAIEPVITEAQNVRGNQVIRPVG